MGRLLLIFGWFLATAASAATLPWEVWRDPAVLARLDAGDSVVETSSRCPGGCRYDRSNPGAEDPASNPYPLRWLYRDGAEVVLLDEPGPGALTRLWLTTGYGVSACIDPAIHVRLYVDDAPLPTIDVPLPALFDGSTAPFTTPLVAGRALSSGGYVSRVPIAHARSLRIALTNAEGVGNPCAADGRRLLWYQLQHHRIADAMGVVSFDAGHDEPAWRSFLGHAGDDPWNGMLAPVSSNTTLAAGGHITLAARSGAGWLRGIRLRVPRDRYPQLVLRISIDGATAVELPLADFFAMPAGAGVAARGVLFGEDDGGWLYSWWPMPFRAQASVELLALPTLPAAVAVAGSISFDTAVVPTDSGRFTATLRDDCVASGALVLDDAVGAGKIVGIAASYRAHGVATRSYLEGDEMAWVDGAQAPAWYGTGVEDFHDGGFYFDHGAFAGPLAGATQVDADGTGVTSAYRLLLTDALPYASSLRLQLETGLAPSAPVAMCARRTVYAYRQTAALRIAHDAFEVGEPGATAHGYIAPAGAQCAVLAAMFEGEPPASRTAVSCSRTAGNSHFRFRAGQLPRPLRLRRTLDAGMGDPGRVAGSAGALIFVNGRHVGAFAPAAADPLRRWQQQDAWLDVAADDDVLDFDIAPIFSAPTPIFTESRWELHGGWRDTIFVDGFESAMVD